LVIVGWWGLVAKPTTEVQTMTEAIINLQTLLVKSCLLNAATDEQKSLSHWIPGRAGLASGIPLLGAT
jgi:hypothetical protein